MKSKSFTLFVLSLVLLIFSAILSIVWESLNSGPKNFVIIGLFGFLGLLIGTVGAFFGIYEIRKRKGVKTWVGLIGNLLFFLLFIYVIVKVVINNL